MTAPRLTELCSTGGCAAKYDPRLLAVLVEAVATEGRPDLLVALSPPDDAAVLDVSGESGMVFSVDFFPPMVDDPEDYGRIAANNALGDIYAMGGRPRIALAIAGIPASVPVEVASAIVGGASRQCQEADAALVGGHTIRTTEPIFGLAVAGFVNPGDVWRKAGAASGDALVLTKPLGSGIAVTAYRQRAVDAETFGRVVGCMRQSNGPAADVVREFAPSAVTDVTGFGLLGHAREMAEASGVRLAIELPSLPVVEGVGALVANGVRTSAHGPNRAFVSALLETDGQPDEDSMALALDPQTAGGLLIALPDERGDELVRALRAAGIAAARVGSVERGAGLMVRS